LLLAASLGACTSKERAPDSARSAALPGQLTKPIDQYTGDEFFDFVQQLRWGGGAERERRCKGDPACNDSTSTKRTVVRVDAVDGQDSIVTTAVPANGVVAVRAQNRGALDEDRYGFKANRKFEYYLIILPGSGPNARWQFEELDTTPGARRHTSFGTGTFKPCGHPFRRGRVIRANFYTCEDSRMTDSVQRSNLLLFAFPKDKDPVWTECAGGCCIAD
jgi:hypothetical protein